MKCLSLFNCFDTCYRVTVLYVLIHADVTCIAEKQPKFLHLLNLLADIEYDWYKISIALEVKNLVLGIYFESNDDDTVKVIAVLHSWVETVVLYTLLL